MKKEKCCDREANTRNTPHLKENILLICLSYGFIGFNYMLVGLTTSDSIAIFLGVIFFCMVPISFFDRRREVCGMFYVIGSCIIHLALSLFAAFLSSCWWLMGVYVGEVVCAVIAVLIRVKRDQKPNERSSMKK